MKLINTLLLLFFAVFANAQNKESSESHTTSCGTTRHHEYLMRTLPEYKEGFLSYKKLMDSIRLNAPEEKISTRSTYTIPVVVHVIHLGEPVGEGSNISNQRVLDAIQGVNDRFSNELGSGLDMDVSFCLASVDPNGNPTTGINRVNGSGIANYSSDGITYDGTCGANEHAIKNLSRWPVTDYYNIWVVHFICGDNPNGGGVGGYANYPSGGSYGVYDGTVIDDAVGYSWSGLAHEIGHGFNLHHTFEGDNNGASCPPNSNCMTQGDEICDTPPHKSSDCGNTNPCTNSGVWDNSRFNWMSYCDFPGSWGRFTQGQKTRLHQTLQVYPRANLLNSPGCDGASQCSYPSTTVNFGASSMVEFNDNTGSNNYFNWYISGDPLCSDVPSAGSEKIYRIDVPGFDPSETRNVEVIIDNLNSPTAIIITQGSCSANYFHARGSDDYYGYQFGVEPSTSYYIIVDGYQNNNDFHIVFRETITPANNDCHAGRTELTCSAPLIDQQLVTTTQSNEIVYSGATFTNWTCENPGIVYFSNYYLSKEKKYWFTPEIDGTYIFNLKNKSGITFDPDIFVMEACLDYVPLYAFDHVGYNSAGEDEEVTLDLFAGTTYYINVDGFADGGQGFFDLSVTGPSCGGCFLDVSAIEINYNSLPFTVQGIGGQVIGSANNITSDDCVITYPGPDKVYKITTPAVPVGSLYNLHISGLQQGSNQPFKIFVYDDDFCQQAFSRTTGIMSTLNGANISSQGLDFQFDGEEHTYYIVIEGNSSDQYYFRVDYRDAIVGINCAPITCGVPVNGNISTANNGTGNVVYRDQTFDNCSPAYFDNNVFLAFHPSKENTYKFTPTVSGFYTLTVNSQTPHFDTDLFEFSACGSNTIIRKSTLPWTSQDEITFLYEAGTTYYFAVDPFYVGQSFDDLVPYGNFTLNVAGAACCTLTGLTNNVTPTKCGLNNGSVTAVPVGGSVNTYQWSNGAISQTISNLAPGTYTVTVTSQDGCSLTAISVVTSSSATTVTASSVNESCNDCNNGSATANPAGGSGYTYKWSNGATTQTINNLTPGNYSVTVTSAAGCTATTVVTIGEFGCPTIGMTITKTNPLCFGDCTGSAIVVASGGAAPYSYLWSNGSTINSTSGLCAGQHFVTILDANGCANTATFDLNSNEQLLVAINQTGNSLKATATGGKAPYSYSWSNGSHSESITPVESGIYKVTITDANGCMTSSEITYTLSANGNIVQVPVRIFPNPAGDFVTIESADPILSVLIRDTNGQLVFNRKGEKLLDLKGLINGMYIVKIQTIHGFSIHKLVIAK